MIKKMMLLAVAAAAVVAFAVPAAASASAIVKNAEGEPAASITAVSENTVSLTGIGTLECDTVHLALTLSQNDTETALASGTGEAFGGIDPENPHVGECVSNPSGLPILITSVNVNSLDLKNNGTGTAQFSFTYDITHPMFGSVMCTFNGAGSVAYKPGSSQVSIVEAGMVGTENIPPCPEGGIINGTFDVSDENGDPATIG